MSLKNNYSVSKFICSFVIMSYKNSYSVSDTYFTMNFLPSLM